MKHKKFVKQLMSTGQSRNLANVMADICCKCREPYAHAWERYKEIMQHSHKSWWFFKFLQTLPGGGQE